MNTKVKSAVILLITFVLGVLVGVLIDRTFSHVTWEKRVSRWRQPDAFGRYFERIIQPTEEQKKAIEKIVSRYSREISQLSADSRQKVREKLSAMRSEIDSLLTDEQRKRLEAHFEKMRKRTPRGRRPFPRGDDRKKPPRDLEPKRPLVPERP